MAGQLKIVCLQKDNLYYRHHVRGGMVDHLNSHQNGGPFVVWEAHASGYYRLAQMDGKNLMDPINGKWLKHYYA